MHTSNESGKMGILSNTQPLNLDLKLSDDKLAKLPQVMAHAQTMKGANVRVSTENQPSHGGHTSSTHSFGIKPQARNRGEVHYANGGTQIT